MPGGPCDFARRSSRRRPPDAGGCDAHVPAPGVPELSADEKVVLALLQRQGNRTVDELLSESGLDFATLQTCLMTLSASGLVLSGGPGPCSAIA